MKKYKQAAASIAILTIMLSAGLYGNTGNDQDDSSSKKSSPQQEAILTAFENRDYSAWQQILAKNNKDYPPLSEKDFADFIAARLAARSGNYGQAIKIAQQLVSKLQKDPKSPGAEAAFKAV